MVRKVAWRSREEKRGLLEEEQEEVMVREWGFEGLIGAGGGVDGAEEVGWELQKRERKLGGGRDRGLCGRIWRREAFGGRRGGGDFGAWWRGKGRFGSGGRIGGRRGRGRKGRGRRLGRRSGGFGSGEGIGEGGLVGEDEDGGEEREN